MLRELRNLIKTGINQGINDTLRFQEAIFKWLGRPKQKVQSFVPFGTFGNPQDGTQGILFNIRNNESNIIAFNGDPENRIKKNCKKGEYGIGNPLTKTHIYFKEDGSVEIKLNSGNGIVITKTGDIELNGNSKLFVTYDELNSSLQSLVSEINTHIHTTTATIGSSATPGVISSPTVSMDLDISSSKTTTIKTGG